MASHRDQDSGEHADRHHAEHRHHRMAKLRPADAVIAAQRRDVEQTQNGRDEDCGQRRRRQIGQRRGEKEQDRRHRHGGGESGDLGLAARRFRNRRARGRAAHDEAAGEAGRQIAGAEGDHVPAGVDRVPVLRGEAARGRHHTAEGDQDDAAGPEGQRPQLAGLDRGDARCGKACRNRADHGDALPVQAEHVDGADAEHDRHQRRRHSRRQALESLQQDEQRQTDGQGREVGFTETRYHLEERAEETRGRDLEAEQLGELAGDDAQRNPVQIAGEDGPREEVCDDAEACEAARDTQEAGQEREGDGEVCVVRGIADRHRCQRRGHDGTRGGIRIDDELP